MTDITLGELCINNIKYKLHLFLLDLLTEKKRNFTILKNSIKEYENICLIQFFYYRKSQ